MIRRDYPTCLSYRQLLLCFLAYGIMFTRIVQASFDGVADNCRESWNVSVVLISFRPPAVRVHWQFNPINFSVTRFELTYRPLNARYRVIHDVPGEQRSLVLDRLQPSTEYQLYLVAFALSGHPTNISSKVHFVAPDVTQNESWIGSSEEGPSGPTFTVREEEVVIVVLVLAVWVFVIVLFFNKWGKIRMLEPYQPQYHSHPSLVTKPARLPLNDALAPLERFNLEFGAASPTTPYHLHMNRMRPRQNSVFVGSPYRSRSGSVLSEPRMPRKVKSAEDIKSMVIQVGDRALQQSTAL